MTLSRRRLALCAVAAVFALAVGFLAARATRPSHSHPAASAPTTAPTPGAATSPLPTPSAAAPTPHQALPTSAPMVSFSDPRTGFRLSYPRAWPRLSSKDPAVPLLLSSRDGISLRVGAVQFGHVIDGPQLALLRDVNRQSIRSRPGVQVIAGPRPLAIAGRPGYLYLYSFLDPLSQRRVGHSQIVLAAGRRLYTLVFQTARAADLTRFAQLIDKITVSFRAP